MKRFLLISTTGMIMLSSASFAQTWIIGARVGPNFANQNYANPPSGESISGRTLLLAGVEADYRLAGNLALSLQLLYDQKGAHADMYEGAGSPSQNATADWTMNYLEVPILVKATLGHDDDIIRPYFFAGPSFGFLISNMEKVQYTEFGGTGIPNGVGVTYRYTLDTTASISDSTGKLDFSLIAGLGISINAAHGIQFFIDAGYAFGLINSDHYQWDKAYGISVYSRDIRVAAGILFPIR